MFAVYKTSQKKNFSPNMLQKYVVKVQRKYSKTTVNCTSTVCTCDSNGMPKVQDKYIENVDTVKKLYYLKVALFAVCIKTSFAKAKIFLFSTVKHATLSWRKTLFLEEGVSRISCQKFAIVKNLMKSNHLCPEIKEKLCTYSGVYPISDLFSSTLLLIFSSIGSPYYPELSFPAGSSLLLKGQLISKGLFKVFICTK